MSDKSFTSQYDSLHFVLRLVIQIVLGAVVGGVYRIFRYVENKNVTTLVVGILTVVPPISFVAWVVDLVTLILNRKYTVFVD